MKMELRTKYVDRILTTHTEKKTAAKKIQIIMPDITLPDHLTRV